MMRAALAISVALIIVAAQLPAMQNSAKPTGAINAKQILEKNLAAMGGPDLHALQRMQLTGSIAAHHVKPSGDFVFLCKAPASDSFELNAIGLGQMVSGQKDGVPFYRSSARAVVRLNSVSAGVMAQTWRDLLESDYTSYREIKLVGLAEINRKWAYALRFEPKAGDPTVGF